MNVFGAIAFAVLAGLRIGQIRQGNLLALLLFAQAGLAAFLFVRQSQAKRTVRRIQRLVAWGTALLPLLMRIGEHNPWTIGFAAVGLLMCLWSLWALGGSFGIAPADRGLVQHGPYRYLRHPMYLGELVSLSAAFVAAPSFVNGLILAVMIAALMLRIRWEEGLLAGYAAYSRQVPWRLIWRIW